VHLVGALGFDHVDHFLNDVDVGGFYRALHDSAQAGESGVAGRGRAARSGFDQQVAANRLQPRGVDEIRELQGADLSGRGLSGDLHADDTIAADRDALRTGRNRDGRLNLVAVRVDQLTLRVGLEVAVTGVGERTVGLQDLEESAALNRQIQRIAG